MERLPVEVLLNIAQYLEVKDLASCCAVSPWWRDVFGSDQVWKPRCDVDSEEYLKTTPCRVEPKFTSPQSDNSTLSPIGRWRIAYMREAHMWRNLISGNRVEDKVKCTDHPLILLFLNNALVVIIDYNRTELFDTSVNPSVRVAQLENHLSSRVLQATVVRGDMFLAWSRDDVQVIGVDLQSHTLSVKHSICVMEGEFISDHVILGSVFLCLDSDFIHVWNWENGTKLNTNSTSLEDGYFTQFGHNDHIENEVVIAREILGDTHCFMYNVRELRFLPFTVNSSEYISGSAIVKHYVALSSGTSVKIYNYQTSQLLHDMTVSEVNVVSLRGSFIFINENQDLVQCSPPTGACRSLFSGIIGFRCFSEKLIVVHLSVGSTEVWKVGPESTVKTSIFAYGPYIRNQAHSKRLFRTSGEVACAHFW